MLKLLIKQCILNKVKVKIDNAWKSGLEMLSSQILRDCNEYCKEDQGTLIYHAGDLNDWVWEEESDSYNEQMTVDYRRQIDLLAETLNGREIDAAFVVLDPRQEKDYDRGLLFFLENISAKQVYPMHYWDEPAIIETFLKDHPEYELQIQRTE